jgi:hypothetical protein
VRKGLPGASDNISDGTWVTLAARASCPIAVALRAGQAASG